MTRLPLLLLVAALGCRSDKDIQLDSDPVVVGDDSAPIDADGDGFTAAEDCDDGDANVSPAQTEVPYDGLDNDCDENTPDDDLDGDGFGEADDCDDGDADIFPGATEVCNGEDDNCDGVADDAVGGTWYVDADGDGYGDPLNSSQLCEGDTGLVADGSDCDDTNADVNPGEYELCGDGADNDCDGATDEDDAYDAATWYADTDRDGYGDAEASVRACEAPAGYVDDDEDCDDGEASTYPGATERCDSVDNDCDGEADEDASDAATWYADADGDGYGAADYTTAACDAPSGYVSDSSDCDDGDGDIYPGASERCDDADEDCDGSVDEGLSQTWYLDLDGDGYGDDDYSTEACEAPTNLYVSSGGDCDDSDTAFNPGASQGCDGGDYDCDGSVDNDGDGDGYADLSCGGDDCDDSDASIVPTQGGGCALGTTCKDILDGGYSSGDGIYTIDVDGANSGHDPWDVYCDMSSDGGGWTLLGKTVRSGLTTAEQAQIREGTWVDYTQDGYGAPETSSLLFWAPLSLWHEVTNAYPFNVLWIEDSSYELQMEDFEIGSSSTNFEVNWASAVSGYYQMPTAVKGQDFTTHDNDNDTWGANCAYDNVGYNGGWWYTNCYQISMLHSNGNVYSWRSNIDYSVSWMYIWFRED